jgi:hypothetical protein
MVPVRRSISARAGGPLRAGPRCTFLEALLISCLVLCAPQGARGEESPPGAQSQADQKQKKEGSPAAASKGPAPSKATRENATPATSRKPTQAAERPAAERPADPSRATAPLRFTDDDLQKYHGTAPSADDEEVPEAPSGGDSKGVPAAAPRKTPPRPAPSRQPAPVDPLKGYHDRDALEKFRSEQVQGLREKIARAQERLDYLKAKKDALETPPTLLQPGRTVGQDKQTIPPATLKPGTIFPGGKPHDGFATGIFPAIPAPQTDEDKEKDRTLKPKELLEKTNEEIAGVEEELEDLKKQLAGVEARSQREMAAH